VPSSEPGWCMYPVDAWGAVRSNDPPPALNTPFTRLFAGTYAIEALALFALGTADRLSRDLGAQPPDAHSEHPPVDRQ
jgi:hypothetical protein